MNLKKIIDETQDCLRKEGINLSWTDASDIVAKKLDKKVADIDMSEIGKRVKQIKVRI